MAWLVREGTVLATLDVADTRRARRKGLLGRDGIDGAIWLTRAKSVHTLGMRFAIDVAFLDRELRVVRVRRMPVNRMSWPCLKATSVIEAEAGVFAQWNLQVGDVVEVRGAEGTES